MLGPKGDEWCVDGYEESEMKMFVLMVVVGGLLNASAEGNADGDVSAVFTELMMTTNLWGRDVELFRQTSSTNMMRLRCMPNGAGQSSRLAWMQILPGLQAPTNNCETYRVWNREKVLWLTGCAGRLVDVSCTNLWYGIADEVRRLRANVLSEKELLARYRNVGIFGAANGVSVWSGMPDGYYEEAQMQTIRLDTATALVSLVVDTFGRRGLVAFPYDHKELVYSNLVQRAGLTDSEAVQLRHNAKMPDM